jgi:hypothetical protein
MPRPKRQEAVVPTTALVASAVTYRGKAARVYQGQKDWQRECYRHYGICGEARFAAQYYGHALSRASIGVAKKGPNGPEVQTSGSGYKFLEALFGGRDGQPQILHSAGVHLTVAGEFYLVGREVEITQVNEFGDDEGTGKFEDVWEVISVLEMRMQGSRWWITGGDGNKDIELTDDDTVIRVWRPHPEKRMEADSPFRALLPILVEIEWLTRHVFAQVQSRLAGAGLLILPQGMTFPPPPAVDGLPQVTANEADAFVISLADAMMTPLEDPSAPSALVPLIVTAPDEVVDKAHLLKFWSELDANSKDMRQEAVQRFALGMDLPAEQITGMSGGGTGGGTGGGPSHWGQWQIEEATVKMHIEPMLELFCNAITIGYLRPLNGPDEIAVYNTAALRLRPDRSREAIELYNLGVLSKEAMLRENGFDPTDVMPDDEHRTWLLTRVAAGSATPEQVAAALKVLGVDLGVIPSGTEQDMREARPAPSIEDHPNRDLPDPELLAAANALVFRALERAGNRIRQQTGVKPPGVRAFDLHTLHQVNGTADAYLHDAWSCAAEVLEGIAPVEATVENLDAYIRSLFASQKAHSRQGLAEWLERTS